MTDTETTEIDLYSYLPSWEYLGSVLRDATLLVLLFVNSVLLTVIIVEVGIDESPLAPGIDMLMTSVGVVALAWMGARLVKNIKGLVS